LWFWGEKPQEEMGNAGSGPEQAKKAEADGGAEGGGPPSTVRFFPSAAQHTARQPPPIKLEEEDVPPPPGTAGEEEDMAPRNLWQVHLPPPPLPISPFILPPPNQKLRGCLPRSGVLARF
jgi:hypothetical protein